MTTASPVEHIRRWSDAFTDIRRDLHAHPELGFEEHRTARLVCDQLTAWSIEHHAGVGRTGIVAVIPGRSDANGRRIGLRADMYALAVTLFLEHGTPQRPMTYVVYVNRARGDLLKVAQAQQTT